MPVQDDSAVVASSATMIAIFGKDPDKGKTGVWFKNKYNHEDELKGNACVSGDVYNNDDKAV